MLLDINELIASIREEQEIWVIKWKILSSLLSSKNEDLGAELHGKVQLWFHFKEVLRLGIRSLIQGCSPYNKGNFVPSLTCWWPHKSATLHATLLGLSGPDPRDLTGLLAPSNAGMLHFSTPGDNLLSFSRKWKKLFFFMLLGLSARVTKWNMSFTLLLNK